MKRMVLTAFVLSVLFPLVGCDRLEMEEGNGGKRTLVDFNFGYTTYSSKFMKMLKLEAGQFTMLNSEEAYEMIRQSDLMEEGTVLRNKFEYREEDVTFTIQPNPQKNVGIRSVTAVSSDTSVVKILSTDFNGVTASVRDLGDVDITVTVSGNKNDVVHVYPLRVIGTVDLKFRITPFWLRKVATKIRMNTRKLPAGVKDMVLWSSDSVTVVGYCEFYDFAKYGKEPIVKRDTVTYPKKEFMCHYKKHTYYLLRTITDAIRKYEGMSEMGSKVTATPYVDESGKEKTRIDTVDYVYDYIPEQVILSYVAVCDNPYIEFVTTVTSKKTFDVYQEGQEPAAWSEESDDVGEGAIVDDSEDEDEVDEEDEKITQHYFKVELNDFLTQHQRDSLLRKVEDFKKKYNYNEELSEEDKDRQMEEINKHLD